MNQPVLETNTTEPVIEQPKNPLLARLVMPGQTFRLPSGGLFYTHGELSDEVMNGELHVHPMTTYDEILMKSPDMLFTGKAIEQVFRRCIPQVQRPLDLFSKDVDFLLTCLRMVSFGEDVVLTWKHDCQNALVHEYKIPLKPFIDTAKRIDPTRANDMGKYTAPNGQLVVFRPPRMKDVIELFQAPAKDATPAQINAALISSVLALIDSVDGVRDRPMIRQWLEQVPAGWMDDISTQVGAVGDWGPSFETTVLCKDCGEKITLSTPVNPVAFFT